MQVKPRSNTFMYDKHFLYCKQGEYASQGGGHFSVERHILVRQTGQTQMARTFIVGRTIFRMANKGKQGKHFCMAKGEFFQVIIFSYGQTGKTFFCSANISQQCQQQYRANIYFQDEHFFGVNIISQEKQFLLVDQAKRFFCMENIF